MPSLSNGIGEAGSTHSKPNAVVRRISSMLGSGDSGQSGDNSGLTASLSQDFTHGERANGGASLQGPGSAVSQVPDGHGLQLTGDDLSNLAYSFQACDIDDSGSIEASELLAMLNVLTTDVDIETVNSLMTEAKAGCQAWTEAQDERGALASFGGTAFEQQVAGITSRHGVKRHHANLKFQTKAGRNAILAGLRSGQSHLLKGVSASTNAVASFVPGAETAMSYSQSVAVMSAEMAKNTGREAAAMATNHVPGVGTVVAQSQKVAKQSVELAKKTGEVSIRRLEGLATNVTELVVGRDERIEVDEANLSFNEFIFMMQSQSMGRVVDTEWRLLARQMRAYRHAFDTTDVDGNHVLEYHELQIAMLAIDPHSKLSDEDIPVLWSILAAPARAKKLEVEQQRCEEERLQRMSSQALERSTKFKAAFSQQTVTTHDKKSAIATVGVDKDMKLEFEEFLMGMAAVQRERSGWVDVLKPNRWELLSLLIDTPISKAEEQRIIDDLSSIEKVGFRIVQKRSLGHTMDKQNMRSVLTRAGQGKLRSLDSQQVDRMASLQKRAILMCGLIGFVFAAVPATMENILGYYLAVDGVKDAYWVCHTQSSLSTNISINDTYAFEPTTPMDPGTFLCATVHVNASTCVSGSDIVSGATDESSYFPPGSAPAAALTTTDTDRIGWITVKADRFKVDRSMSYICSQCECVVCGCAHHAGGEVHLNTDNKLLMWWLAFTPVMLIFAALEIVTLFYCAMGYTTQVAWALDIRLSPVNADRAFVANALVRAAFELGNSNSPVLGVDPGQSTGDGKKLLLLLIYKGKVVITGVLLKVLVSYMFTLEFAYWAKPWLGIVFATILWDAFTAYSILIQARIKGIGVYSSVEIFNEIVDTFYASPDEISKLAAVQMARAVGVCIVVHGSLHPTMELLLRHTIQFLGLRGSTVVSIGGILDDVEGFLTDLDRVEMDIKRQTASQDASTFEVEAIDAFIEQEKINAADADNPVFEREGSVDEGNDQSVVPQSSPQPVQHPSRTGPLADFLKGTNDTLTERDQQCILSVLLLAALMDGDLNRTELQMWQSACEAVGAQTAEYHQDRIELLCDRYRGCEFITARDIHDTFDPAATVDMPAASKPRILWWWITRILSLGSC